MMMHGGWGGGWRMGAETPKVKLEWRHVLRAMGYLRPYWRPWSVVLVLLAISNLMGLIPPLLMQNLIDHAIPSRDAGFVFLMAAGMVAFPLIGELLGVARNYLANRIGQGIMFDLRN